MQEKTIVLITGANQGIGYETAKNLLRDSEKWHVLLGCRDNTKGAATVSRLQSLPGIKGIVELLQIDVTDDQSVDAAAAKVGQQFGKLDILVNNAGIAVPGKGRDVAKKIFEVNVVGVISVTDAFLPLLKKSGEKRAVFVSSTMGCLSAASNPKSPLYAGYASEYRASKAAVNMIMVQYQHQGLVVHGMDPGRVATHFGGAGDDQVRAKREGGAIEPEEAAMALARVIRGERDADHGRVVDVKAVVPW